MSERVQIRKILDASLKGDSDVNAFVLDHFPDVYKRFSDTMNRQSKINTLLEQENPGTILMALQEAGLFLDSNQDSPSPSGGHPSEMVSQEQQVSIARIRLINQSLGSYSIISFIQRMYVVLILAALACSLINSLPTWITRAHVARLPSISYAFLPIGISHLCLYVISRSFYQTYFLIWDMTTADRVWSAILWLFHIVAFVTCLLFPGYWGLIVSVLVWAIHAKNRLSLMTQPAESPARPILEVWIARSGIHARISIFIGLFLAAISNPLLYWRVLEIPIQDGDPSRKMLEFYTLIFNFMAFVPLALISYNKVRIVVDDDFRTKRIDEYNKKMEIFLRKFPGVSD